MIEKYPVESDFLQSYLNSFVIGRFFNKDENFSLVNDAKVFNSCVHLNPTAYNLANCSDKRDRVEAFIASQEETFNKYRTVAIENCKSELMNAHGISVHFEKDLRKTSASELNLLSMKKNKAEDNLFACVNGNLL
jgi:hypothetical protein